jgi:hypothetical protein
MQVQSVEDVGYVRRNYFTLEALASAESLGRDQLSAMVSAHVLPGPAYVLPSGEPMFPRDLCALLHSAGGAQEMVVHFRARFLSVARQHGSG